MLPKSSNHDTIFANPNHTVDIKLIVGEIGGTRTTYSSDIMSLATHCSLYGEYIDIGQCVINSFEAVLHGVTPTNIPKLSRVEVWCRLRVGNTASYWLPKGVFYTRKPDYDTESQMLSISGFDMMYRGEALPYPLGSTVSGWNLETTRSVATRMATFMGITMEDATQIPEYDFALPPFGYTAREILHDIGTACGGNFTLTYVNSGTQSAPEMTPKLRFIPIGTVNTPTDLGRNVQRYEQGDAIPCVSHVIVNYGYDNDGATLSKECGTSTHVRDVEFTISTITDGDVIQSIANTLYNTLVSLTYIPFAVSGVPLDPACEIGDIMTCNSHNAPMGSIDTQFSKAMYASIVAPSIPEEEDFPMYSADREIQRNYETEASKIAGAVKFVDLSTAGATEINGSNIKSGTIKLGGDANGNGVLSIYDENDVQCGEWDNEGLVIYDDSSMTGWIVSDNKIRIVRQGDAENATQALKMGVFSSDSHTSTRNPYIQLAGLVWDSIKQAYKSVKTTIMSNYILIQTTRYTSQADTGPLEELDLEPYPVDRSSIMSATKTNNSSTANMTSFTMNQWGRVVQFDVHLTNVNYTSAGDVMWEGDITMSGATLPQPEDIASACGFNGSNFCMAQITGDGANDKWHLVVRAVNGYSANWTANLSFTFLV